MPLVVIPGVVVVGSFLLPMAVSSSVAEAQDQAPPCPAYVLEGTISAPETEGSDTVRTASVYAHTTGEPLANRQVIATFTDASGATVGEPAVLVTDAGGRAEIAVPDSADSVNFVAEAPDAPGCLGEDGADQRVLLEILPVGPPPTGPTEQPDGPPAQDTLAHTGPVSDVIALASVLLLALGASVGTGRGRRRALARAHGGGKSRFPR